MSANNNLFQQSSSRTATSRVSYFFRKGGKENRERQLRGLFIRRAKKGHSVVAAKSSASTPVTTTQLFRSFFLSTTPFIALKTRRQRRGKRVVAKVGPLDRVRGERKSLVALSSRLQSEGAVKKPFPERLERELEVIDSASVKGSTTPGGSSQIRDKRDELHRTAFQSRPFKWASSNTASKKVKKDRSRRLSKKN